MKNRKEVIIMIYSKENLTTNNKILFEGNEIDKLEVTYLRYDNQIPYEWIALCTDNNYPEIKDRLIEGTLSYPFNDALINLKNNKSDKLINIRIGEFKDNIIYKIPYGGSFSNFVYALIVGDKIKFYSSFEQLDEKILNIIKSTTYKCITKDKYITKKERSNFINNLLEKYKLDL